MPTKIYVGNLPWRATDEQLTTMFSAHGEVTEARIVTDRETGRSRGFAFVTMTDASQAQSAIQAINGASMEGRALVVNEAREQSRPPRGPGGGGGRRASSARGGGPNPWPGGGRCPSWRGLSSRGGGGRSLSQNLVARQHWPQRHAR
ncbi:MAG: RNA-binding protein [Betaproteobacteria bacterium]|nr:RNA-binding protein [Betaproteobacteria bacterium]